jgi:hypothetical protein
MRPEKARYQVQSAINKCLKYETFTYLESVKLELIKLLKIAAKEEHPYESDSYYGTERSILTLMYVSDRWMCTGRLKWLIDVAKEQKNE